MSGSVEVDAHNVSHVVITTRNMQLESGSKYTVKAAILYDSKGKQVSRINLFSPMGEQGITIDEI